jgi:hypothetical protein
MRRAKCGGQRKIQAERRNRLLFILSQLGEREDGEWGKLGGKSASETTEKTLGIKNLQSTEYKCGISAWLSHDIITALLVQSLWLILRTPPSTAAVVLLEQFKVNLSLDLLSCTLKIKIPVYRKGCKSKFCFLSLCQRRNG